MQEKNKERKIQGCPACGIMSFPPLLKTKKSNTTEPQKPISNPNAEITDTFQDGHEKEQISDNSFNNN